MSGWRGSALLALALALAVAPIVATAQRPPDTPTEANIESYFGVTIDDPYRWLEALGSTEVREWFTRQNDYTREVLDVLPGRAALRARIADLNNTDTRIRALQSAGDSLFYLKRLPGQQNFQLCMRGGQSDEERIVVDPAKFDQAGKVANIDYFRASSDCPPRMQSGKFCWPGSRFR